ncbi:MAG: sel1 repeat family protein [Gammaproteobacteria bacterium]|nr:sel1 repeat family protein [Gammaproteobacteria bacterium]MDH5311892.1 sel1 repeat family protein [Gammaproteobacteria bacterium]
MRRALVGVIALLLAMPALAALYGLTQIDNLYENETSGLKFYEKGEYEQALTLLRETAALGLKRSQYILGFMFLKGEGVERNALLGLAWMGLATESGNEDWQASYDQLYGTLNDTQKAMLQRKIEEYRAKYGAVAQGITCAKTKIVGSRKVDWVCRKSEGSYELHEIEIPAAR